MATLRTSFRPFARTLPLAGLVILTAPFVSGCELFVHFDRSRIDADSGVVDSGQRNDSGPDGGHDAGMDSAVDANLPDANRPDTNVTPDANDLDANDHDANRPDTGVDAGCVDPTLDCPATSGECVAAMCSGGGCTTMNLDSTHVLTTGQTPNDCTQLVCDGAGGSMPQADSADHATSTTCDTVSCTGTTVTHVFAGTTVACTGGFCDAAGHCNACNVPGDCPTSTNECLTPSCVSHVCGFMSLGAAHTMSTGQTSHNCQKLVCSADGLSSVPVDDATDLPAPSTTVCRTAPACTGSPLMPTYTNTAMGTPCVADTNPPNVVCGDATAAGMCVQCNMTTECTSGTCHTDHTCS